VFALEAAIFYAITITFYESMKVKAIMISIFSISLGLLIITTLLTGLTDPSDSIMITFRNG
jgi:hypothetical protein